MSKSGGNLTTQYNLRWPDELKEKIAQSAKEHNRSMNADIVARLEKSFEPESLPMDVVAYMAQMENMIHLLQQQAQKTDQILEMVLSDIDNPTPIQKEILELIKKSN